jgi:hypothetical protein
MAMLKTLVTLLATAGLVLSVGTSISNAAHNGISHKGLPPEFNGEMKAHNGTSHKGLPPEFNGEMKAHNGISHKGLPPEFNN